MVTTQKENPGSALDRIVFLGFAAQTHSQSKKQTQIKGKLRDFY